MASKSKNISSGPCDLYTQPNCRLDCIQEYQEKVNAAEVLSKGLNRLSNIRVSGGPFHYQMRSGQSIILLLFKILIIYPCKDPTVSCMMKLHGK
jgi:hypothetical protein